MKNLSVFFSVLVTVLAIASCTSLEKILPQNTGTWSATSGNFNVYEDNVAVVSDSVVNYNDGAVSYQFNEDGTGVYTEDGQSTDFNWTSDEEMEQITMEIDGFPIVYDVLDYSKSAMTLFYSFEIEFFGIKIRTDSSIDLEKVD